MVYENSKTGTKQYCRCAIDGNELCYYHAKVLTGNAAPSVDDEDYNKLVAVEVDGATIWTL